MINFHYTLFIKTCILCINYQISIINVNKIDKQTLSINKSPTFQSEKNVSFIYNQAGKLKCKIITKYIQYFSDNARNIYFVQPTAILFNDTNTPIWCIKSQKSQITYNKIMYLQGNVQIINLKKHAHLQCITTNTAILNLTTYDISSNEKTTIQGEQLNIVATSMTGNLKKKFAELSEKVYTLYETKTSKKF